VGPIWHANFSPDGRTILFTRIKDAGPNGGPELWSVPVGGGKTSLLLRLPSVHNNAAFGTYSPDGSIAYRRTQYDGLDATQMTDGVCGSPTATGAVAGPCRTGGAG
jgi:tricorn protease-like protein